MCSCFGAAIPAQQYQCEQQQSTDDTPVSATTCNAFTRGPYMAAIWSDPVHCIDTSIALSATEVSDTRTHMWIFIWSIWMAVRENSVEKLRRKTATLLQFWYWCSHAAGIRAPLAHTPTSHTHAHNTLRFIARIEQRQLVIIQYVLCVYIGNINIYICSVSNKPQSILSFSPTFGRSFSLSPVFCCFSPTFTFLSRSVLASILLE